MHLIKIKSIKKQWCQFANLQISAFRGNNHTNFPSFAKIQISGAGWGGLMPTISSYYDLKRKICRDRMVQLCLLFECKVNKKPAVCNFFWKLQGFEQFNDFSGNLAVILVIFKKIKILGCRWMVLHFWGLGDISLIP